MCGICGIYQISPHPEAQERVHQVRAMMGQMAHRGPDDEGTWTDACCTFGFRRLAILDLSPDAHQPMLSADGRYVLVYNGEVYNFQALRAELAGAGHRFRSTGDTEVVLAALAAWGTRALSRFNGMFALAFLDTAERTLLLARDHAGIKPLYYMVRKQGVVFGSQYNQILRHPWTADLEVSREALSLYLRLGHVPAPYALLKETFLLEAGCWVRIGAGGRTESGRFHSFPDCRTPDLHGPEAHEAFEDAFTSAVRRHLISDVPVGVFLSGGIDSPLVAAEAARQSAAAMRAFTIGVDDPAMDERQDAAEYARELNLLHETKRVDGRMALQILDEVVAACTEPTADFSIFPTFLISQVASERVKVVLSGDGGDELFWGYPSRFGAALRQARYYRLPQPLRYGSIAARKMIGLGEADRDALWSSTGRLYQKKHTILLESDLQALFPELCPIPADFPYFAFTDTDRESLAQKLRWSEYYVHLANVLAKVDRASMYHSLEVRVPLLDKEVIAVAARIDWQTCLDIEQGIGKLPLRSSLRNRLRHHTVEKKGFTVPMHEWLAGPLQPLVQERVLTKKHFLGLEANSKRLQGMNRALLAGDRSRARGVWLLLSLVLWEEAHFQQPGRNSRHA